jgi:uncharacterized iron-regulated protein
MRLRRLRIFFRGAVLGLTGGMLGCASIDSRPAASGPPADPKFWSEIASANVIYVGERHTEAADHEYEFALLKGLKARGIPFAVGWEMFEASQQPLLSAWQSGRLSTGELLKQTDWAAHWGKYSPIYERMLRWSRSAGVESYALNAPASLAHKIARGESLTPEEQRLLPTGYRALPGGLRHFISQMGSHPGSGTMNFSRYYRAQTVWDQTMADRIVELRRENPARKLVVFAGRGHVEAPYGIPPYVKQKMPDVLQVLLLPGAAPVSPGPGGEHR